MKQLGNVLYILTPDSYLYCENETIAVKVGGLEKARIPSHTIESVVCFGMNTVSVPLIRFCGERGIGLSFCTESGRFCGRFAGPVSGNVLLRKRQYALYDEPGAVDIARNILSGKLANSNLVLQRAGRERKISVAFHEAQSLIEEYAASMVTTEDIETLRGLEGKAAAAYFGCFESMQTVSETDMLFAHRTKHPPENRMNALMSFLYMLCKNDVQSALENVGLDPAVGYLHALRPGRPSLALDLMEELRAPLCDRIALSLTNKRQIQSSDFNCEGGRFRLGDQARRTVIDAWQTRKHEVIQHPFLGESIPIGLIPNAQAMLLARHIRSELDEYPPFLWR